MAKEELKRKLNQISQVFFDWLEKMTIENWRLPIEEPIEKFATYSGEAEDLLQLYEEYENDEETLDYIDKYLNQVVKAVNNGTVVERRGGAREGSGRKKKSESGKAVTVSFSCSPEQKEQLQKDVAESGVRQSEYILSKLF